MSKTQLALKLGAPTLMIAAAIVLKLVGMPSEAHDACVAAFALATGSAGAQALRAVA